MPKQLQPNFSIQWLLVQIFGSIAVTICTQGIVTLIMLLCHPQIIGIYTLRLLAYLLGGTIQGYFQWYVLKQAIGSIGKQWISTPITGLPISIVTFALIHLGLKTLVLDEDGTVLIILAIIGAIGGALSGRTIGNRQKSLLKQRLYWRSLWHDWDRDYALAGALGGITSAVIIITSVLLFGWNWLELPLPAFLGSIGLALGSEMMYGFIVGDTIYDVFKQAKLLE
jgi:hypothetical protein